MALALVREDRPAAGGDAAVSPPQEVTLSHPGDFAGWRRAARRLLASGVPPQSVTWRVDERQPSLFEAVAPEEPASEDGFRVPRHFVRLAEQVVLHGDPGRFALLYRLLWRVTHGERAVLHRPADRDVARVEAMAAEVRRAAHKLRHLTRFREVPVKDGSYWVGWFELEHHVLERVAPHFAATFVGRRWLLVTPVGTAWGDGAQLRFLRGGHRRDLPPPGSGDGAWQAFLGKHCPDAAGLHVPADGHGSTREARTILLVSARPLDEQAAPVGALLDRALTDAGLRPERISRTHALEGSLRRPKRRRLDHERLRLRPDMIVALGAAAAEALLERPVFLPFERGRVLPLDDGSRLLVTVDPASVLGLADATARGREYRRFVSDLLLAVPYQRRVA